MLQQAPPILQKAPHVIVVGNEKGGSGKTTLAMHVAIALINDGQRVGRRTGRSGQAIEDLNFKSRSTAVFHALKGPGWRTTKLRSLQLSSPPFAASRTRLISW